MAVIAAPGMSNSSEITMAMVITDIRLRTRNVHR